MRTVAVLVAVSLAAAAFGADHGRFPAAAGRADQANGYASTSVELFLRAGVVPSTTADGARTLALDGRADAGLAAYLRKNNALAITPVFSTGFADPASAARLGMDRMYRVDLPRGSDVVRIAGDLAGMFPHLFERTDLDGIATTTARIPNDASFGLQYGMNNTGQTVQGVPGTPDADIDAPEAWDISVGADNIRIAIVDTGVSTTHPDVAFKVGDARNFTTSDPADYDDRYGHGTHCAGIAAAFTNNTTGVAGVCWSCSLLSAKVLSDFGFGQWSWVAAGIQWAADQRGVRVISMSLGGGAEDATVTAAINYALSRNVLVIAAAGNNNGGTVIFPGWLPQVLSVSATNNLDQFAAFSSQGPEVDVSAPGQAVYSTYDATGQDNSYTYLDGTSMATPHVSGLAGLIVSINPRLTAAEVREVIELTVEDKGAAGFDTFFGLGRINAFAAALMAQGTLCQADFNGNGQVDFFDYLDFAQAFSANEPRADFDHNGQVDFFDYLDFAAAFDQGCE
jgi:thermitase